MCGDTSAVLVLLDVVVLWVVVDGVVVINQLIESVLLPLDQSFEWGAFLGLFLLGLEKSLNSRTQPRDALRGPRNLTCDLNRLQDSLNHLGITLQIAKEASGFPDPQKIPVEVVCILLCLPPPSQSGCACKMDEHAPRHLEEVRRHRR